MQSIEDSQDKEKRMAAMKKQSITNEERQGLSAAKNMDSLELENHELARAVDSLIEYLEVSYKEYFDREKKLHDKLSALKASIDEKTSEITSLVYQEKQLKEDNFQKEQAIQLAALHINNLINSKIGKIVHLVTRIKDQLFSKNVAEMKQFLKWISKRSATWTDGDRRFQPLYKIQDVLIAKSEKESNPFPENAVAFSNDGKGFMNILNFEKMVPDKFSHHLSSEIARLNVAAQASMSENAEKIKKIIRNTPYTGIIVYPHVVYWEPLQTPQQLLRAFARQGWLCFFCDHPNLENRVVKIEENVFLVHETDLIQAAQDEEIHILLTWLGSLPFVQYFNKSKIWYHILDDLNIFPYYGRNYEIVHREFCKKADWVSYVSSQLKSTVHQRTNAIYLPNGVNPEEIIADTSVIPKDMANVVEKSECIVGYFGHIAEWMNVAAVCEAALARPRIDFVFIGNVRIDLSELEVLPNVHILGPKKYNELPKYASHFDICFIPFEISEAMDCVSPIKFYEYCAYGKPVISSKMKELEQYQGKCIRLYETPAQLIDALDEFNSDDIKNLAKVTLPEIAANNSWTSRALVMEKHFQSERRFYPYPDYRRQDIIIFGIIDYKFRYQRPQHFARLFAESGHRVFYINPNHNHPDSVKEEIPNLFLVDIYDPAKISIHLTDWHDDSVTLETKMEGVIKGYSIKDASILVDYPNWIGIAKHLRKKFGFLVFLDYMDDFTGFLNPSQELVRENSKLIIKEADFVVPSSEFLEQIIKKYRMGPFEIIRNGTEFSFFNKAATGRSASPRKTIGYYGAIAHWFDVDKVCYVADAFPDAEIVLIGEVTEGLDKLSSRSNIRLLGEKPYETIPGYLKDFDVCLIPFETSTELIKATNPVKFYEYLSAGKKVVATEIPELEPFKDKFVYLSNDDKDFADYVRKCLDGTDTLAAPEECMAFARENDWTERYDNFSRIIQKTHPLVSIVVLSFNNYKYTKLCIESILSKTAYPNYEIILVDNASDGETRRKLQEEYASTPKIKVILNDKNLGFAGGNNVGIRASNAEFVILLNNDTIVTRGWVTNLMKHMIQNPKLGMVGPVTNSIGNEAKILVKYHNELTLDWFASDYTYSQQGNLHITENVLALFCALIRKDVLPPDLLDENYGKGMFEDDDLSYYVKKNGYLLGIAQDAFVHHFQRVSFKNLGESAESELYSRNKLYFEKKWNTQWKKHQFTSGIEWDTNIETTNVDLFNL